MSYELEASVPIPAHSHRGKPGRYPFASMKVGDSFLVPGNETTAKRLGSNSYCWAQYHKNAFKFVVRQIPDGVRCWRYE